MNIGVVELKTYQFSCGICGQIGILLEYPVMGKMYRCYHCNLVSLIRKLHICNDPKCDIVHVLTEYIPDCGWEIMK